MPWTPRQLAPWIVVLARAGYAAKGIVYAIVGILAARLALGHGGDTTDTRGALGVVAGGPFGQFALAAIGIGLLGYALWRLIAAATDAERRGDDPTSLAVRAGEAGRGVAYGVLGVQALRVLVTHRAREGGAQARGWTARLLELPGGKWLVVLAGLGVIGYAAYQLVRAFTDRVKKRLALQEADEATARTIVLLGRVGIAARAMVFAMLGVLVIRAGWAFDPSRAGGFAQSLDALARAPHGRLVLLAAALGLVAYGGYQLGTARYRRMRM